MSKLTINWVARSYEECAQGLILQPLNHEIAFQEFEEMMRGATYA